jgi:hypothetical protein
MLLVLLTVKTLFFILFSQFINISLFFIYQFFTTITSEIMMGRQPGDFMSSLLSLASSSSSSLPFSQHAIC